jgi:hypothetical protein
LSGINICLVHSQELRKQHVMSPAHWEDGLHETVACVFHAPKSSGKAMEKLPLPHRLHAGMLKQESIMEAQGPGIISGLSMQGHLKFLRHKLLCCHPQTHLVYPGAVGTSVSARTEGSQNLCESLSTNEIYKATNRLKTGWFLGTHLF